MDNYEKKYKEALERARKIHSEIVNDELIGFPGQIESIFPELAESEDERALRIIKKRMCYDPVPISDEDRRIVENWLEKQKEQKHPNGCFTCDEYKKGYEAGRFHGFTAGYNKAMKEQKPVEWSEEDEDMLNSCISSIEEAKENRYAYKETDGDTSYDREINWLKSLRPQSQGTYKQIIHSIYNMLKDKDFFEIRPPHLVSLLNDIRVKCKDADECATILDEPS